MASNDVLALEANFSLWQKNRFPAGPPKGINVFEYYCIEQFARASDLGDSQLKAGMVGAGGDGGIDAFYILAAGEMVDAETELDPKSPPDFRLLIMQVKSDEGFSPVVVDKLYWFTDDLLNLSRKKADYHSTYHLDLVTLMRLFKDKFGLVVGETPPPLLSNSFENHVGAVDRAAGGEDERAIQVELKLRHKQPERITHPWKEYAAFSVRFCVSSHAPYLKRPCANTKPRNTPRE